MSSGKKNTSTMVTGGKNLHVVFLPYFVPSHMLPLVDAARQFAARGVRSTIITTVYNALTIKTSIDRDIAAGYPITVHTVNFPASEVGLPIGVENFNACTTEEMKLSLARGITLLKTPLEELIRDMDTDCIFSDMFFTWTVDLAYDLKIPRLLFYPNGLFYQSVFHSLKVYAPHAKVKSESESFLVPNLPDKIMMKRSQVSDLFKFKTMLGEIMKQVKESEDRSYGAVNNTFYEIEPAYVDHLKKIKNTKIWHIGPLFHFFNHKDDKKIENFHSRSSHNEKHSCLRWLDDQKPKSVIYACFGSIVRFPEAQINEIALALEESRQPFIWVIRKKEEDEEVGGLPQGFKERMEKENKGLIITEWAPQVEILQHPSVGGFLTHCGWNSVLEAVVNGVPLVTWPLFADHFYNEKLVELLGIGVGIGVEVWNSGFMIKSPIIEKRRIIEAIAKLTSDHAIAERVRGNLKELTLKANLAVKEGGSSFNNLTELIEDIRAFKFTPKA